MEYLLFALLIQGLVFGFFCSYIAKEKNRGGINWFCLGFFFSILAVFALIAVPRIDKKESNDDSNPSIKTDSVHSIIKDDFSGDRDLSSSGYQLFLIRRYSIEKNATLEKYVIDNEVFDTFAASLREADFRYTKRLTELFELEEDAHLKFEYATQKAAVEHAMRAEREASLAPARAKMEKAFVVLGVLTLIGIVVVMIITDLNESRAVIDRAKLAEQKNIELARQMDQETPQQRQSRQQRVEAGRHGIPPDQ